MKVELQDPFLAKNAANDNKTFPTIKVMNYQGPAVVVVSCVEDKPPFRAHPHNLVGKNSKRGVFSKEVDEKTMTATFNNLGIQCATRKDAAESLQVRQSNKVDPFKQGFDFNNINSFNLNAVKLCFQCFIRTGPGSRDLYELPAKVSDTIFDAKAYKALTIAEISDNNAPVEGGKKIILLCEKVSRDDIEIRFFYKDPKTGEQKMLKGHFSPNNVHHQVGITFTTPVFPDQSITESIEAQMILHKPSDECVSDPVPFYFTPRNFLEPAVPGAAKNLKRTKEKVKVENNDNNPSDRSLQNPHKKLPSSGGRMLVKTEESGEPEKVEKISFVENYLKNTEHLSKYKNVDINNIPQKELEAIVQTEASSISLRSSEIPKNLDEIVANPQNINLEVFDDLSGQLKDMDVSDQRITRSRTRHSNSTLETPDVSMEQGRSSSSKYNNLNK